MTRRNLVFRSATIATLILGLSAGSAFAFHCQGKGDMGGPDHRGPIPMEIMQEKLDLDAETVAAIEEIRADVRGDLDKLEVELLAAEQALRNEFEAENPDPAATMERAEAVENLRKEIHLTQLECNLRTNALLTAEQRKELRQLQGNRPGRGMRDGRPDHCRRGMRPDGDDQGRADCRPR